MDLFTQVPLSNSVMDLGQDWVKTLAAEETDKTHVAKKVKYSRPRMVLLATAAVVLMCLWSRYLKKIQKRPSMWGSARLAMLFSGAIASVLGWVGVTSDPLQSQIADDPSCIPDQQVMACCHPHGCYVMGAFCMSGQLRDTRSPMHDMFVGTASFLYDYPIMREFLLMANGRPITTSNLESLITSGKTVGLFPGGVHEMAETDPTQERGFFPPNLGFVRMAMKHGIPMMPLYTFGENQLYDVPEWSRALSRAIARLTGNRVPIGTGPWGLPFLPKKTHLQSFVGQLVEVGPPNPDPSDAQVRDVFLKYCTELRRLFDTHKDSCLPPEVAARGLTLIWRDYESEDLSASALLPSIPTGQDAPNPTGQVCIHRSPSMSRL